VANFCTSCGTPVSGQFCTACGAAIKESPAETPNVNSTAAPAFQPAASPAVTTQKSSGSKVLVIVLGALVLFGAVGVGGIIFVGYRAKQKFAEMKKEYGGEGDSSNGTSSATMRTFPPSKGNGCSLLEGQEAAGILGVVVERAESETSASEDAVCKYWVSAAERKRLIRGEIASSVARMGDADSKSAQQDVEKLIGGAAGALIEVNGDNKDSDSAFTLQVWRKGGKDQWEKTESLQARTKDAAGADFAAGAMQSVEGVGERATVLAAGHSIMVLKGDSFFLLGFQQFVPGRDKAVELARVVAGRL
jgi:hypothetical protein